MSLFNDSSAEPTVNDVMAGIKEINTEIYRHLDVSHREAFNIIWNNEMFTPKEVIAAFGMDAYKLFQLSAGIQDLLSVANPDYVRLVPTKTVDIDPNTGVVTIGD
jgi:hypothetical protein